MTAPTINNSEPWIYRLEVDDLRMVVDPKSCPMCGDHFEWDLTTWRVRSISRCWYQGRQGILVVADPV